MLYHPMRFLGGVSNTCSGPEGISQILNRRWLLTSPDTRIQPVLVSCRPEDDHLQGCRFSIWREPDLKQKNSGVFYVIRDDLLHPIMGGNKLRKLDALLPLLHSAMVTDVITCGGCQSAHAAALAVACAENGLRAHLLLRGERLSIPTGYNLISGMYGQVTYISRSHYADREAMLANYAESIAENGPVVWLESMLDAAFNSNLFEQEVLGSCQTSRKVAIVKEGASDATALLGLIRLVDYLAQPCCFGRDQNLQLVVDSGTGTTAVGLAVGILILRLPWEVVGVTLVSAAESYRNLGRRLLDDFNKMWTLDGKTGILQEGLDNCIHWVERQRPRKFGNVLEGEIQSCRKIAKETGILLDPIYTLAAWEAGSKLTLTNDKKVVVLHTGGTMSLFGLAQRYSTEF